MDPTHQQEELSSPASCFARLHESAILLGRIEATLQQPGSERVKLEELMQAIHASIQLQATLDQAIVGEHHLRANALTLCHM